MRKILIILVLLGLSFSLALPTFAALPTLVPAGCRGNALIGSGGEGERCDLSSVETLAINVTQIILGVTGSLALLMFVLGGVKYMLSRGKPESVSKATAMLTNSVIGIAIILLAGVAVKFILKKVTGLG